MNQTNLLTSSTLVVMALAFSILPRNRPHSSDTVGPQINGPQKVQATDRRPGDESADAPKCEVKGEDELTINCEYKPVPRPHANSEGEPWIVLNRAAFSFGTHEEGYMHIDLTFKNAGDRRISLRYTVYVAIDDDKGQNHVRRQLPHVEIRRLEPNQPITFSESLLAPAFSKGHYSIHLWIPASDPQLKLDPANNLLLSSVGVPDRATGLNTLAEFTVHEKQNRKRD